MFTAISTMEPSGHGRPFSQRKKMRTGGSTYTLPKSHSIFNQKSDIIELSPTAREKLVQENEEKSTNDQKLSKEEQKEVKELERIDRQVRSRELTHRAVAGSYTRGEVFPLIT